MKRKKDVQVYGTLGPTQTPTNIENPDYDVNSNLSKFQDSFNHVN